MYICIYIYGHIYIYISIFTYSVTASIISYLHYDSIYYIILKSYCVLFEKKTEVSKFLTHCFVPKRNQFFSCQPIGFVGVALASSTLMRIKWKHTSKHIIKQVTWNMLTLNPTGL